MTQAAHAIDYLKVEYVGRDASSGANSPAFAPDICSTTYAFEETKSPEKADAVPPPIEDTLIRPPDIISDMDLDKAEFWADWERHLVGLFKQ